MSGPPGAGPGRTQARLVHAAVAAATVVVLAVFAILRRTAPAGVVIPGESSLPMRAIVLTLAAGGTIGLRLVRAALPPVPSGTDPNAWWRVNLGRAIALWALPDGIGVAGAVLYYLSGDALLLALAGGWAVTMFFVYSPGRLTGG